MVQGKWTRLVVVLVALVLVAAMATTAGAQSRVRLTVWDATSRTMTLPTRISAKWSPRSRRRTPISSWSTSPWATPASGTR